MIRGKQKRNSHKKAQKSQNSFPISCVFCAFLWLFPLLTPEALAVDSVLPNLVIDDAFSRSEQSGSFRAIASRGFQRIQDNILFKGGDRFRERKRRDRA